jgi:hypothetical protein
MIVNIGFNELYSFLTAKGTKLTPVHWLAVCLSVHLSVSLCISLFLSLCVSICLSVYSVGMAVILHLH